MSNPESALSEKDHLDRALDIAVRLFVVGVILFGSIQIVGPFVTPLLWGGILAVSLYPPYDKLRGKLGGRDKLAGGVFIVLGLAALFLPGLLLGQSLVEGASRIGGQLNEGKLEIPAPSLSVKEWPVIGGTTYELWDTASHDLHALIVKLRPQLKSVGVWFAAAIGGLGGALLQTVFAIIIAGMFLMHAAAAGRAARAISNTLAREKGTELVEMAVATIRSVVKGVLAVAFLQSLMSAVGLFMAGVPGAGFWALLVLVVAIMQLPPLLVLGPIAFWVFSTQDSTTTGVLFLIWSLVISASDAFLKPLLLGRGVQVPMLVILIGAIGGMLRSGVVGLFTGAVILAIGYQLVVLWMADRQAASATEAEAS